MRTLIYVPIIHTSADLGSLAKDVTKRGVADLGTEAWREHQKTIEGFWYALSLYFNYGVDEWRLKIYQDGMVAEGEIGAKIVEEGLRSGSKNYEIVDRLLKQGAILVKTEDFNLVKEERDRLLAITQAKSVKEKLIAFIKYKLFKNRLLRKRDRFIAQRIDETLNEDEKGVIFIGAFHNVQRWLAKDIQIKEIKDMHKIREYYRLLPFYDKHRERFEELSRYLRLKVKLEMSFFEEIQEIICEQLKAKLEEVKLETSFIDDLGADSLDSIELVMALEGKFNLEITDEDAEKMNTVEDVVKYIAAKTNRDSELQE